MALFPCNIGSGGGSLPDELMLGVSNYNGGAYVPYPISIIGNYTKVRLMTITEANNYFPASDRQQRPYCNQVYFSGANGMYLPTDGTEVLISSFTPSETNTLRIYVNISTGYGGIVLTK